jgi:SAM-dependent methyltransferase
LGRMLDIVTPLHRKTKRDCIGRMTDNKVDCMIRARRFDIEYWDGDRRYGFGGYRYDGRWEVVARKMIELYHLPAHARILDVGSGKGFLLYEFAKLLPECQVVGFDVSPYAIDHTKEEVRSNVFVHKAEEPYPYGDRQFDLVISLNTLHNLQIFDLKAALQEIERVGKQKYVLVEGYRNEEELFNLQCWALTAEAFFRPQEWIWMYKEFGYTGDYEFIYFE